MSDPKPKTITGEEYERLGELIADARALNEIQERLVKLAEDITGDWEMNSDTFDACNNSSGTVDDLLQRRGIIVAVPGPIPGRERTASGDDEGVSPGESTVTRAGLEPATYGLKGPGPNAGDSGSDAGTPGSASGTSGDRGRSAPENAAASPDKSPDDQENAGAGESGGLLNLESGR